MICAGQSGDDITLFNMPLSRRLDPVPSFQAAEKLHKTGKWKKQKLLVLETLRRHNGSTSAEISKMIGPDRYLASRRLPELERKGLVARGRIRLCRVTGSRCLTWWVRDGNDYEE